MSPDIPYEITDRDYAGIAQKVGEFLLQEMEKSSAKGFVLGLSGGIDSAVLACMCGRVASDRTLAVIMPDSDITPNTETADGIRIAGLAGIDHRIIDIRHIIRQCLQQVKPDSRAAGNLRARIRSDMLYYHANAENRLVLGSSNKSEYLMGYFTKFGDGAADLTPLISLYKLQVRGMAGFLGVPQDIIAKKSSPHLWENHYAEDELGATYEQIDSVLYCIHDRKMSVPDAVHATGLDETLVEHILCTSRNTAHKRMAPRGPGTGAA